MMWYHFHHSVDVLWLGLKAATQWRGTSCKGPGSRLWTSWSLRMGQLGILRHTENVSGAGSLQWWEEYFSSRCSRESILSSCDNTLVVETIHSHPNF